MSCDTCPKCGAAAVIMDSRRDGRRRRCVNPKCGHEFDTAVTEEIDTHQPSQYELNRSRYMREYHRANKLLE